MPAAGPRATRNDRRIEIAGEAGEVEAPYLIKDDAVAFTLPVRRSL